MSKNSSHEHERQQFQQTINISKEQIDKLQQNLHQIITQNEQLEYTINDLTSRNELIESKLIETMTLVDLRNKTLIDSEQQMDKIKIELIQKHKDLIDKQAQVDELEQIVIEKSAEVAELTETLETGLVKSHHREKFAEDNASKAIHDVKVLQREVHKPPFLILQPYFLFIKLRHLTETLGERDRTNAALNEQLQHLTNEYKIKQDEFQQMQKTLNKQVSTKLSSSEKKNIDYFIIVVKQTRTTYSLRSKSS